MREAYEGKIIPIAEKTNISAGSISGLSKEWNNAYYKSKQVTSISYESICSGSGSHETCTLMPIITTRTVYYWEEPSELTAKGMNNGNINSWSRQINDFNSKLNNVLSLLPNAPTFSEGADSIKFNLESVDTGSRTNVLAFGFGASAGLFAFYEEIFEKIAKSQDSDSKFWTTISDRKIKRRSLLKLGLGALAVSQVQNIQKEVVVRNSGLLSEVTNQTHEYIAQMDTTADQVFSIWFGSSVYVVAGLIDGIKKTTTDALEGGSVNTEGWDKIKPQLQNVLQNINNLKSTFVQQFKYDGPGQYTISPEFVAAIKKVWTYERIKDFINGKNVETNSSTFAQIATFAALLLGISVGSEIVTEATDEALNHFLK